MQVNGYQFTAQAAQIYSIKTDFQTPGSHSDSKWAKIAAYLILWWMNSLSAPVKLTFLWFNVVYVKKVELMKTSLFTLYALDM